MSTDNADEHDEQLRRLEDVVTALLANSNHSEEELRKTIGLYQPVSAPLATDEDCDKLTRRLIARLSIDVERGVGVVADDYMPWLENKRRDITWERWIAYKRFLLNAKWPPRVVERLDELTDQILDFAGDPTVEGTWARRGLVLGEVQSGKTASYMGLFNKAADAGYRLIIVLAGHTESLRQQTQRRVDEGFIGRDTSRSVPRAGTPVTQRLIGVGGINREIANAQGMTTVTRDFTVSSHEASSITIDSNSSAPYVFVVKKNVGRDKKGVLKGVLNGLAQWLGGQPMTSGKIDVPVLLLDDESDYASVNTKEDDDPTAINDAIRRILGQFSRSSYIAFTATPFANIFIDHENTDDLFPRDFIYSLESPSNYVGAEATFGLTGEENTTTIIELNDVEAWLPLKHKSVVQVGPLPDSLVTAIMTFFLTNAIRDLRGQQEPRSMLVNVSRYKKVQRQVTELVEAQVAELKNSIELYSVLHAKGEPNQDLTGLQQTYKNVFPECEFRWEEVLSVLAPAVSDIRVQLFNSDKDRKLAEEQVTWDRPKRLIAVGGDVLSRGLTLDGLSTSYFYRRTQASDTLLQMARWFGYRDGYADLCRLWIDRSVAADYRLTAESVAELRQDLRTMLDQKLTPKDFGLAVRKHPEALLVTAKNKMKAAETRTTISVLGRRIETTKLPLDPVTLRSNYQALETLVGQIDVPAYRHPDTPRGYRWWHAVPKAVVADFLEEFNAHGTDELFSQTAVSKFVRTNGVNTFRTWDVVLMNGDRTSASAYVADVEFKPPSRSFLKGQNEELRLGGKSARLAGPVDLTNVLSVDAAAKIRDDYEATRPGTVMPETYYYPLLERPALLIYALRTAENRLPPATAERSAILAYEAKREAAAAVDDAGVLVVAIKLAFPGNRIGDDRGDVQYVINSVALKTWFPHIEDPDIENPDEEDVDG
jgi:hypothetical protein